MSGAVSDQTEKFIVSTGSQPVTDSIWESGDALKIALAGHCVVKLDQDVALIAGGYGFDFTVSGKFKFKPVQSY